MVRAVHAHALSLQFSTKQSFKGPGSNFFKLLFDNVSISILALLGSAEGKVTIRQNVQ